MVLHHSPANRPLIDGRAHGASRARVGMIVLALVVAMLGVLNLAVRLA